MKIISPFKDYYDYLQAYGQEPGIVYNRKSLYFSDQDEAQIPLRWQFRQASLLGFCGQIIPRYTYTEKDNEEYRRIVKWGKAALESIYRVTFPGILNLARFVRNPTNALDFLFQKYQCPIFHLSGSDYSDIYLTANPSLTELGFSGYMDAQTVFQSISSFIGNQKEQMPAPPRSDKEKAVSHGFDKKTSFRPKIKQGILKNKSKPPFMTPDFGIRINLVEQTMMIQFAR